MGGCLLILIDGRSHVTMTKYEKAMLCIAFLTLIVNVLALFATI